MNARNRLIEMIHECLDHDLGTRGRVAYLVTETIKHGAQMTVDREQLKAVVAAEVARQLGGDGVPDGGFVRQAVAGERGPEKIHGSPKGDKGGEGGNGASRGAETDAGSRSTPASFRVYHYLPEIADSATEKANNEERWALIMDALDRGNLVMITRSGGTLRIEEMADG